MIALFVLSFAVTLLAVAALAVGRLWNAPALRSCRCAGEHAALSCVACPLRDGGRAQQDPTFRRERG